MAGKPKYTVAQMSDALVQTKGMVYLAAKQLGCNVNTVLRYCARHPALEAVKQAARGEFLDECELRLWKAVQRDEAWAISFALKTVGRSRGYAERLDLNVSIQAAAQKVAAEFGLSVQEVLNEARLLLLEVDDDAH
jgi:hypothetical protein